MNFDSEKKEKMMEFFRKNAFNPIMITPEKLKKKDTSASD